MEITRLFDYLDHQAAERANQPFLSAKTQTHKGKEWITYSFKQVHEMVNRVSAALIQLGIQKNDKIALIAANSPEWNFIDLGVQQIGAVCVPMYPTISQNDYEFIFNDAEIVYAFVGDENILQRVLPLINLVPSLKGIYTFQRISGQKHYSEILPEIDKVDFTAIESYKTKVSPDDLATIIYTSGTTGNPKGVMLSHDNLVSNLKAIQMLLPFLPGAKSLSFLPLCHSFERIVFYAYLSNAVHIHYAESLDTIGENLKEVQPYCFTTVPRLLEKVYEKIMEKGLQLTGVKKKLFFWAVSLGLKFELNKNMGILYDLQLSIARKLIFSKWQEALGGKVQFIVTGAAAFQPRLARLFTAAGISIIEGYGLTETSPVLSVNRIELKDRAIGTVGLPIPGVTIQLAPDGEIIAKGPNIMKGYYKRPDLTAEVIDEDGWFHTGDIGEWLDNRFLKITDRKKELFKTSGGKYIAPQVIENKLKESPYIEQIMVVGDSQKYVAALIVPSFLNLREWAKNEGLQFDDNQQIVDNEKIKNLISAEIETYNRHFGKWEQIKKVTILPHEWSIETGELTPTMKLKRKIIAQKFASYIEALYQNDQEVI
ncbi:MAG: long-chain fatty acid--CoA ligase [Sphingobacteriales bacterium]|nr:MAG: long-chain fatty acid--CoA ligase [Sphingobacteriales bacterium]